MLETIIIGGLIITAVNKTKNRKTGKDKREIGRASCRERV